MRTLHGHRESGEEDRGSGSGRGGGGGTRKTPSGVAPCWTLGRRRLRPEPLRQRKQKLPGAGFSRPPSSEAPFRRTRKSRIRVLPPPLGGGFRLPRPATPLPWAGHAPRPSSAPVRSRGVGSWSSLVGVPESGCAPKRLSQLCRPGRPRLPWVPGRVGRQAETRRSSPLR